MPLVCNKYIKKSKKLSCSSSKYKVLCQLPLLYLSLAHSLYWKENTHTDVSRLPVIKQQVRTITLPACSTRLFLSVHSQCLTPLTHIPTAQFTQGSCLSLTLRPEYICEHSCERTHQLCDRQFLAMSQTTIILVKLKLLVKMNVYWLFLWYTVV